MNLNLNEQIVRSQFSEDYLAKQRDPGFVAFAKRILCNIDPEWKYLREDDANLLVDMFTIEDVSDKETAKQFFVEHILDLQERNSMALPLLLGQLKNDNFFTDEENHEIVMAAITQSRELPNEEDCKKVALTTTNNNSSIDEIAFEEVNDTNAQNSDSSESVTVIPEEKTNNTSKKVLGVLLTIALIAIGILSYLLYDTASLYTSADTDLQLKTQRVASLKKDVSDLENELDMYKNIAKSYDNHAVIVVPETDNYYHRIGCSHLPDSYTYWAYNVESAVDHGYSRCPDCMTQDFDDYVHSLYL